MHRLTLPERLEIIKKYYQNSGSVVNTQREFRHEVGRRHGFSAQAIRRTVEKFEREYTLLDLKPPTRQRSVRSEENIATVAASIEEDPEMSIRRRSAELGISRESIRLILRLDLGLHPYSKAAYESKMDAQNDDSVKEDAPVKAESKTPLPIPIATPDPATPAATTQTQASPQNNASTGAKTPAAKATPRGRGRGRYNRY